MTITIAIDGPTASGKGTLARRLAHHFGYHCLDTGLLYRAVGMTVAKEGGNPADPDSAIPVAQSLDTSQLSDDNELRTDVAGQYASQCSTIPGVREALLRFQREFAAREPGSVLDGRDIGTVICPDAPVKLYITASAEVRAQRRHAELERRGKPMAYEAVLLDIKARDDRDMNRATAPLKPASDAITLDTTTMNADEAFAAALKIVTERLSARS